MLRWILKNGLSSRLNSFAPSFYAVGSHSLIGMPWNIFRTTAILSPSNRPTTFNTVVGTLGPYTAVVVVIPEYDLAFSLMMNGALGHPHGILANISFPLIRAADEWAWTSVRDVYAGRYEAMAEQKINSSITFSQSSEWGLYISEWISNGSSILPVMERLTAKKSGGGPRWVFQVVPTLLEKEGREGFAGRRVVDEEWRWTYLLDGPAEQGWNDWCLSSFDPVTYAGQPLARLVFRRDMESGAVLGVDLGGYNITLKKVDQASDALSQGQSTQSLAKKLQQEIL